jgi:hypothetical protein
MGCPSCFNARVRVYWRLGSRIGVSMPWWLAMIAGLVWLACLVPAGTAWLLWLAARGLFQIAAAMVARGRVRRPPA